MLATTPFQPSTLNADEAMNTCTAIIMRYHGENGELTDSFRYLSLKEFHQAAIKVLTNWRRFMAANPTAPGVDPLSHFVEAYTDSQHYQPMPSIELGGSLRENYETIMHQANISALDAFVGRCNCLYFPRTARTRSFKLQRSIRT